jgi:multidrug efflux pump subunit AcrA (membrane-fusion protein)
MVIQMSQILKKISQTIVVLTLVGLGSMVVGCASNKYQAKQLADADIETLQNLWLESSSYGDRHKIIQEFERRKSLDGLKFCLVWSAYWYKGKSALRPYNPWRSLGYPVPQERAGSKSKFSLKDAIEIANALGRIKNPEAIQLLRETVPAIQDKEFKIAVLNAFQEIGSPQAEFAIMEILKDPDPDVRFQALDVLGRINATESTEAVFPMLLDDDANIRWKAVHTLGEIGDPRAAGRIGFLLSDPDKSVQGIAENVLKKLGTSEAKIADWKKKAGQLSIDEVYRTKLAYQKAEIEKQELVKKLENEKDLKKQLEDALKNQETASGKQKNLVESLYEKERQLKSKQAQLDITRQQSEQHQAELQRLNAKVQSLNAELKQAKTQAATENVKAKLDKTLQAKSKLEQETKTSREKESMLREEIASLNALAEKTRLEAEAAKKEVIALRNREKQLTTQVDELKQRLDRSMAPVLVVSKPVNGAKIESPNTLLHFIAVDDKGIRKIDVSLNGNPVKIDHTRGLKIVSDDDKISKKIDIAEKLQLQNGQNIIKISVIDTDGISQEELIQITRVKERGDIWAIVIGINQYQHTRNLKYAVNDARAFKDYLKDYVAIPDDRIYYLANQDATKSRIESLLGTTIKRKASKDDTVIIFYAGHGAVEPDPSNLDGDGFEKYLLPHDADLEDLYSTSISMNDIRTIFTRIRADRLIFIADTCYSGASGGRTMMATKTRANLSDKFYERISKGKGRVIISSCSANEISKEDDSLQHGVFSYYMLEGLKGRADQDGDGIITVSELFSYISRKVPAASAQDQHPVKKGETEGELVIGRVK